MRRAGGAGVPEVDSGGRIVVEAMLSSPCDALEPLGGGGESGTMVERANLDTLSPAPGSLETS